MLAPVARVVLMAGLLCPALATAQIYKWTDAEGRVHYSERSPDLRQATVLEIPVQRGDASPQPTECHTIRCQYERLRDDRLLREAASQREAESRARVADVGRMRARDASPVAPHSPVYVVPVLRRGVGANPAAGPPSPPRQTEPAVRLRMP